MKPYFLKRAQIGFVFFALLMTFLLCYYFYTQPKPMAEAAVSDAAEAKSIKPVAVAQSVPTESHTESSNEKLVEVTDISKPVIIDGVSYLFFTRSEMEEVGQWLKSRKYTSATASDDYKAHSDTVLEELAKQGDIVAMETLGRRLLKSGDIDAFKRYETLAAIYGSTPALMNLSDLAMPSGGRNQPEPVGRPRSLEALAISKVLSLRGDEKLARSTHTRALSNYKIFYSKELVLTEEEQQKVDVRAQEIYDEFQKIRTQNGLGDFENSVSAAVERFSTPN